MAKLCYAALHRVTKFWKSLGSFFETDGYLLGMVLPENRFTLFRTMPYLGFIRTRSWGLA
jgi:hypothetical protein